MRKNRIHDNKDCGVLIYKKATATLDDNTIQSFVWNVACHTHQQSIQRTPDELAGWAGETAAVWLSGRGLPGVFVEDHSTISMPLGSNTNEGNGKGVGQVVMDSSSQYHPQNSQPRCAMAVPF